MQDFFTQVSSESVKKKRSLFSLSFFIPKSSISMSVCTEAFLDLRDVYIDGIMEDMDRNEDGFVTLEEYLGK